MNLHNQFLNAGFTINPNNIHNLPGKEWSCGYAGGNTIPFGFQIREIEEIIYIFKDHVTQREGTGFVDFSHSVVKTFMTVDGLLNSGLLTRKTESLPAGIWGD